MTENHAKHRGDRIEGPRHRLNKPDDPSSADLEFLFPGTSRSTPAQAPKPHGKAAAATISATGTIMLAYAFMNPPTAPTTHLVEAAEATPEPASQAEVVAATGPIIAVDSPKVSTQAAPPPPAPKPAPVAAVAPAPVAAAPVAPKPTPAVVVPDAAAPAPAATGSGTRDAIVAAAMAQLGVNQDCTMLVTNSLQRAGFKYFHDWPVGYLSLGRVVPASEALPGDLIYYVNGGMGMAHIAVYIGNGNAVHGGWNWNQTVIFSANVGSGPVYIRVA